MMCLLTLLVGAVSFVEQPLDGIRVGGIEPLTGQPRVNFRQVDFEGDGRLDLLFVSPAAADGPVTVAFQDETGFPADRRVSLPLQDRRLGVDVWGETIYARRPGRLKAFAWRNDGWATVLDQDITWPMDAYEEDLLDWGAFSPVFQGTLTRFLHDLNGNGIPEIIVASPAGLHVYQKVGNVYRQAEPPLDVFPPMRLMDVPSQTLWPPDKRHVVFPAREMFCRVVVDGKTLTVIASEEEGGGVRFRIRRWPLVMTGSRVTVDEEGLHVEQTPLLPAYMRPCRLSVDGGTGFAGGEWELEQTSILPMPVHATSVSTDGGRTIEHRRALFFRPHTLFVDVNGNGRLDIVTEATSLYDGGASETVSRIVTARRLSHTVSVFPQDGEGVFAQRPAVTKTFTINLPAPPLRGGPFFDAYQNADLVNMTGDFNGDGFRDFAVRDRHDRLSIYLSRGGLSYPRQPDIRLDVGEWQVGLADVDGDGRTDIVLMKPGGADDPQGGRTRVFFAREKGK